MTKSPHSERCLFWFLAFAIPSFALVISGAHPLMVAAIVAAIAISVVAIDWLLIVIDWLRCRRMVIFFEPIYEVYA